MKTNIINDIISVKELQEILKVGRNTAYKLLENGEIPAFRIGSIYKIPRQQVDMYIEKQISNIEV